MFENDKTDRCEESLKLFSEIASSPYLKSAALFLVFTRVDVFEAKIRHIPLNASTAFADYEPLANPITGAVDDYDRALAHIVDRFATIIHQANRALPVTIQIINCLDLDSVRAATDEIVETVKKSNLNKQSPIDKQ